MGKKIESKDTNVANRLNEFLNSFDKKSEFLENMNIPYQTLQNYCKGRMPHASFLKSLSEVYNVNINWLLTGNGVMYMDDNLPAVQPEKATIDSDLLIEVVSGVEKGLDEMALSLKPSKKAELIILLYNHFNVLGKKTDNKVVSQYLKLVS